MIELLTKNHWRLDQSFSELVPGHAIADTPPLVVATHERVVLVRAQIVFRDRDAAQPCRLDPDQFSAVRDGAPRFAPRTCVVEPNQTGCPTTRTACPMETIERLVELPL
jgi:hypothetical protein